MIPSVIGSVESGVLVSCMNSVREVGGALRERGGRCVERERERGGRCVERERSRDLLKQSMCVSTLPSREYSLHHSVGILTKVRRPKGTWF